MNPGIFGKLFKPSLKPTLSKVLPASDYPRAGYGIPEYDENSYFIVVGSVEMGNT